MQLTWICFGLVIEALNVESSCTEALFNLGLVFKRAGRLEESLECFLKLHAILRSSPEVLYHIGSLYDALGELSRASEWYQKLLSVSPSDANVLARLGNIADRQGDDASAFQYHTDSYRLLPSNLDVISWLGAYYVHCEVYEQAIQFFERYIQSESNETAHFLV